MSSLKEVKEAFAAAGLRPPPDLETIGDWGWSAPSLRLGLRESDGAATVEVGAVTAHATRGLVCRVFGGSLTDALVALRDEMLVLSVLLPGAVATCPSCAPSPQPPGDRGVPDPFEGGLVPGDFQGCACDEEETDVPSCRAAGHPGRWERVPR